MYFLYLIWIDAILYFNKRICSEICNKINQVLFGHLIKLLNLQA